MVTFGDMAVVMTPFGSFRERIWSLIVLEVNLLHRMLNLLPLKKKHPEFDYLVEYLVLLFFFPQ